MTKRRPSIYEAMQAATEEAVKHVVEIAFDETAPEEARFKAQALVEWAMTDKPSGDEH